MHLKKRIWGLVLVILGACLSMGMGDMGEGPRRIPTPTENFAATIVDRADVSTQVSMFSIDGFTFFIGERGKGKVAVPFAHIKQADFNLTDQGLQVLLSLHNGSTVTIKADRNKKCYGVSNIGNFQISLGDIKILMIGGEILPQ